jgi:hypothetical protein
MATRPRSRRRQRFVQITLVDVPGNVLAGAAHGGRVDVGRVHLGPVGGRGHRRTDRARAAAQVDDDVPGRARAAACPTRNSVRRRGTKTPGVHGYPQAAELRPAHNVLERLAGGAPVHHGVELVRLPAAEMSNRASSSAKTQPAARSLVTMRWSAEPGRSRGAAER